MTKSIPILALAALLIPAVVQTQTSPPSSSTEKTLDIYFMDTEGGQATLFVSPTGQAMLVDTGFAGGVVDVPAPSPAVPAGRGGADAPPVGRDASRILHVLQQAGVTMLDYVVITHYHGDHVGGAADLASRIPIRNFVDHGPYTVELQPNRAAGFIAYKAVRDRARAIVPKPGDKIPVAGLDVTVLSSSGQMITAPIAGAPGAGAANPLCRNAKLKTPDPTPENIESIGLAVRYGNFRLLDLADLTWNQESQLACPNNLLGTFDVFHTVASRRSQFRRAADDPRDPPARRNHEQRRAQRRLTGTLADCSRRARPGRFLATASLGRRRRRTQFTRAVPGQPQRNRPRPLSEDFRANGRQLHHDQRTQQIHKGISRAPLANGAVILSGAKNPSCD